MNTMTRIYARQGDIGILYAQGEKPEGRKKVAPQDGQLTLGHGSATGHRHTVAAADADLYEADSDLLLVVHKETPVVHPEHENKVLPAGSYIVRRQHEVLEEEQRAIED